MGTVRNPVLAGFHPDPSIVFVDGWFYVANSTFEWFGGVEISRSQDLAQWEFVSRPLSTTEQLDLTGIPPSGGIWAPDLSYSNGRFWLCGCKVKTWDQGPFCDVENFLITAEDVRGPWSRPVYLNGMGIDPSLFHDTDGRTYLLTAMLDYRRIRGTLFAGIVLQEYDAAEEQLIGSPNTIFEGTEMGVTEGPHLYKVDGRYYLVTAEGGTEYNHAVTVARSQTVDGPYLVHPENPLLTAKDGEAFGLQKAGHGSWCKGPGGTWILAYLVGRPLPGTDRCVLGRETAIEQLRWIEGWPYLEAGGNSPHVTVEVPWETTEVRKPSRRYEFTDPSLHSDFMTLRKPYSDEHYSLSARPGYLRVFGKDSICSRFDQSLIARRQMDFAFRAETYLEFAPTSFQQMAGLVYRYDEKNQYYLRVSFDEHRGSLVLGILVCDDGEFSMPLGRDEVLLDRPGVKLAVEVRNSDVCFLYDATDSGWHPVGTTFDASILSDDYGTLGFTGAFVGMCCQDLAYRRAVADFAYFEYGAQ